MVTRRGFLAWALAAREGWTLVHEHVLVDFAGADAIRPGRYDADEVFRVARPHLEAVKAQGCRKVLECTPNYIGRDPQLLQRLSQSVAIDIWTNTGLYAAGQHKYLPAFAKTETAEQLARRWEREFRRGVDGVTPRFIKIGVNRGPLHEWDRKIVQAAGLASRESGLTIAAHTGDGAAALEELEILSKSVAPGRFVWVHAQNERDHRIHEQVARAGAWVEFDGISEKSADWHLDCVRFMATRGLLGRTLISQDSGWYHVGEPGGGSYRPYTYLYEQFVPRLEAAWVRELLVVNPERAFGR